MHRIMDENDESSVRNSIREDIKLRWIVIALCLPIFIFYYFVANKHFNFIIPAGIALMAAVLNIAYKYITDRSPEYYKEIFVAMAFFDIVLLSVAVAFTGGIYSPLYLVYFFMLLDGCFDYWTEHRFFYFLGMNFAGFTAVYIVQAKGIFVPREFIDFCIRFLFLGAAGFLLNGIAMDIIRYQETDKKDEAEKEKLYEGLKKSNLRLEDNVRKAMENLEKTNLMLVKKNISLLAAHEIYKTANEADEKTKLLEMILGIIVPLMKGHGGIIFSANDVKTRLMIESVKRLDWSQELPVGQELEITPESELYGSLIRRQALLFENIDEMKDDFMRNVVRKGSCIVAPLIARGEALGAIVIFNKNQFIYNKTDAELMELLGEQIGTLLYTRSLFDELKVKAVGLEKLVKILIDIESSLDIDEIISTALVDSIKKLFNFSTGVISMLDDSNNLRIRAQYGHKGRLLDMNVPSSSITGWVFKNNKSLILKNPSMLKFYNEEIDGLCFKDESIISPITSKGKVIGTMSLSRPMGYTREDLYLLTILATHVGSTIEMALLYDDVKRDYINTVYALAAAVDAKDHYTHGHSTTVMKYSMKIAEALGMSPDDVETIKFAGLLHDIGKIGISENIINKPGKLTNEEYTIIKMHPQLGANIISKIDSLKKLVPLVLSHHEWYNGSGYPLGLRGDEIMMGARIISVADAYSTMTSKRPYRDERSQDYAIKELTKFTGVQFDPKVIAAFTKVLKEEEEMEKMEKDERESAEKTGTNPAAEPEKADNETPGKAKKGVRARIEGDLKYDKPQDKDGEMYS
ncbi:MAG: GAF domain-containing protein [Spirochaetia bacterium]|nr:GAF domain-containing protein [Spirochaetia bacterium]